MRNVSAEWTAGRKWQHISNVWAESVIGAKAVPGVDGDRGVTHL